MRQAAIVLGLLWSGAAGAELRLSIAPVGALRGEPLSLRVEGVAPGARVQLSVEEDAGGRRPGRFRSHAVFVADDAGVVDTARDPATEGSYTGTDEAGLFWSMARTDAAVQPLPAETLRAMAQAGEERTSLDFRLPLADPRVVTTAVEELPGALYARLPGEARRPALIVLGGSEGGLSTARQIAPALASRGYAVLGLGYYAPDWGGGREVPELPASFVDLPVERLAEARRWLRRQPGVNADTVGIWGVSKGAELALLGCSKYDWIVATAAIVPSDVVWEGWGPASPGIGQSSSFSWRGRPLPFTPYEGAQDYFGAFERGVRPTVTLASVHARGRWAHPARAAAARIDVAACKGEVLVVGGGEDRIWPSAFMAGLIAERRAAAGRPTLSLIEERAGHGLGGPGYAPTTEYGSGGNPAANGRLQLRAWRAALALFDRQLSAGR